MKLCVDSPLLVGKHAAKLELADKHGIATALAGDYRPQRQADVVIDATGRPEGLELAMQAVRPRGTIVLKTTVAAGAPINLAPIVIDEVTVVGSRCGPFGEALRALADGQVEVDDLVAARYPLRRGLEALAAAQGPDMMKVILDTRQT